MQSVREKLQIFVRRFGLLSASCCDECCGEQVSMVQSHILSRTTPLFTSFTRTDLSSEENGP